MCDTSFDCYSHHHSLTCMQCFLPFQYPGACVADGPFGLGFGPWDKEAVSFDDFCEIFGLLDSLCPYPAYPMIALFYGTFEMLGHMEEASRVNGAASPWSSRGTELCFYNLESANDGGPRLTTAHTNASLKFRTSSNANYWGGWNADSLDRHTVFMYSRDPLFKPDGTIPLNKSQKHVGCEYSILKGCVPPGSRVISLYAGSGTSIIASVESGHHCIAFEKDKVQFDGLVSRLTAYGQQVKDETFVLSLPISPSSVLKKADKISSKKPQDKKDDKKATSASLDGDGVQQEGPLCLSCSRGLDEAELVECVNCKKTNMCVECNQECKDNVGDDLDICSDCR